MRKIADRIQGLSIGLSMDTAEVRRSLSAVKDSFREVRQNARTNINNIKFDTKNIDGYKKSVDELSKTFEQQENNVNDLKSRYDELVASGRENTQEGQRLRNEYNKQVDELNRLGSQLKKAEQGYYNLRVESSKFSRIGNVFSAASGHLQTFGGHLQRVGGQLTKYITKPAVGAVTALGGIAAFSGFQRLVGIDSARAKLQGLGHDAGTVEAIMDNALASVKGTSFGMAEAANTAANAVAAGIEPGEELTRYLTLTGDAAAIAGTDMQEMGSIFNKVQTNNKIQAEEMNQLLDRGIPIIQLLAEELGVAEDEVRDLAAAGEISAEDFLNAVEGGFGGAAQIMGETSFTAAFDNMGAALARVGAAFLDAGGEGGGFFSQMKPLMADLTDTFDNLEGVAADWGVQFGKLFASVVERIKDGVHWFSNLDTSQQKLIGKLGLLAVTAGPLLTIFGKLTSVFGLLLNPVGKAFSGFGRLSVAMKDAGGFAQLFRGDMSHLGKAFPKLARVMAPLKTAFLGIKGAILGISAPVAITVGAIVGLGAAFVVAYKKSETFRNFIDGLKDKFQAAIGWIGSFKDAIVSMFQGDLLGGFDLLRSLGISTETADKITQFVYTIRTKFIEMKDSITNALAIVKNFFINIFNGIRDWWSANGEAILGGVVSGFEWMKETIGLALDLIGSIWKFLFDQVLVPVASTAMPLITGIVRVGIDLIVGIFKVFAPIVKNIWNTLWPVLKNVLSVTWDAMTTIVGIGADLIQGIIKVLAAVIDGDWSAAWTAIRETTSSITTRIGDLIDNMRQRAVDIIKRMVTAIVQWFLDLFINIRDRTNDMKTAAVRAITDMKNGVLNRISELYTGTTNKVRDIYDSVRKWFGNARKTAVDIADDMKDKVIQKAKDILDYFQKLPGRLGNALRNGGTAFRNGFANMFNRGISAVESGINLVISGIDWVLDKLGAAKIGKRTLNRVPLYEKGTDGHPGGPAVVGDGGMKELVVTPRGETFMSPDKDTLVDLPKGTQVLSGPDTKNLMTDLDIPKYAGGIGNKIKDIGSRFWEWASGGAKSLLDKALNFLGVSKPDEDDGPGVFGRMAGGAFSTIKDAALNFISNKLAELGPSGNWNFPGLTLTSRFGPRSSPGGIGSTNHQGIDLAGPLGTPIPSQSGGKVTGTGYRSNSGNFVDVRAGNWSYHYYHLLRSLVERGQAVTRGQIIGLLGSTGNSTGPHLHFEVRRNGVAVDPLGIEAGSGGAGVQRWRGVASQALQMTGQFSPGNLNKLLMQMQSESGGNPRAINNWDSNARRGTPSKGLMQVIDPTFRAYAMPGYNNIWNPLDNILASIRYSTSRYGSLSRAWRGVGYADGGVVTQPGVYALAENGWPEIVIPTEPSKRSNAMKLLALAAKKIQGNRTQTGGGTRIPSSEPMVQEGDVHIHLTVNGDLPPTAIRKMAKQIEEEMKKMQDRKRSSRGEGVSFG